MPCRSTTPPRSWTITTVSYADNDLLYRLCESVLVIGTDVGHNQHTLVIRCPAGLKDSMFARLRRLLSRPAALSTLSSLAAYQQWATAYPPTAHNVLMQTEEAAMLSLLPDVRGAALLDLACGSGRYARIALERGARLALGVDNSEAMLRVNALPLRALGALDSIPLATACMDGVLCGLAIGHIPRLQPAAAEIARVLKPGGWALISDFHPFVFLNGARRTFTGADGRTYAVEHYAHLYSDVQEAFTQAGLVVECVLEPRLDPSFAATPAGMGGTPVVIVYRMRKLL